MRFYCMNCQCEWIYSEIYKIESMPDCPFCGCVVAKRLPEWETPDTQKAIEYLESIERYLKTHYVDDQTITLSRYEIECIGNTASELTELCWEMERQKEKKEEA